MVGGSLTAPGYDHCEEVCWRSEPTTLGTPSHCSKEVLAE